MSLLRKEDIYHILNKRLLIKTNKELLTYLSFTKNNFIKFSFNSNQNLGDEKYINPLLWQMGHVVFFYCDLVLKNLYHCKNININNYEKYSELYDSFKTPKKYRKGDLLLPYVKCIIYYNEVYDILVKYIKQEKLNNIDTYLILLGILHNEMHNEAFIFSKLKLHINKTFNFFKQDYNDMEYLELEPKFINYKSGLFVQGSEDNSDYLIFDNEMPSFCKKINKFSISKYPITEFQYFQFIKNNGYETKRYWSNNGYKYIKENNINLPLYWLKDDNKYYKLINGKKYDIETNIPITNISYYEAEAYCKWKKGRLPLESEYEYIATNEGLTKFPWGNNKINSELCNINYINSIVSVKKYKEGNNYKGVSQLIGNVWEWCQESIYPYDGFKIDPVYREMSYPYFGFKKICKGGSFAVSDFLIHPKYRNAQYPDCRIQFIGFRICKD